MKALEAKGGRCKFAMLALPLAVALTAGALCACSSPAPAAPEKDKAPAAESAQPAEKEKEAATPAATPAAAPATTDMTASVNGYPNFLDNSAGMFADTYFNSQLLNTGNRGCNACHTDLFTVMDVNQDGFEHIMVSTGYDKNGTYKDCEPCHRTHTALTGMYMGDIIHASHYSNETFVANNGNCWSCHAVNADPETGEFELVLFDDLANTPMLGGYPDGATSLTNDWIASRGFRSGFVTSMATEAEPNVTVTFDQEPTDTKDVFVVNNWGPEVTGKGEGANAFKIEGEDEVFDFDAVCDENNTVTITGVKEPKTFTKAELQAMPQTDFTMHLSCGTNGNGGALTANVPMTGVPMEYILEQCGGVVEGNNAVTVQAYDGWMSFPVPLVAETYTENAYLVTKQYGQDLTDDQGGPIMVASPGHAGVIQVKHIKTINFVQSDMYVQGAGQLLVNGMWFQNNGATYKMGQPIELSAAAYAFTRECGDIQTISFSFDMGQTWKDYSVASEVSGYDPDQWTRATLKWTPSAAGSYTIMMQAKTDQGVEMNDPVALVVVVEE